MFAELQPLLDGRSFTLIINPAPEGQIRLNFIPTAHKNETEQDKPLLTPLTITGTPEELDGGLAGAITEYRETYLSMRESVAATKKQMADAKAAEEAKRKAEADAKKNANKKTPASPAKKIVGPNGGIKADAEEAKRKADAAPSLFYAPAATDDNDDSQDDEETFEG